MKVALLTREYPPDIYGGAGVHIEYLSQELARLDGVDVDVRCFGEPRPSPLVHAAYQPWDAIPTDRPHSAALGTLSVDLLMAAGIEDADVVHSHTWYANIGGHLAKLLYGIPHVITSHSLEPLRPWKAEQLGGGYEVSKWCERTGIEAADAVVAVSAGMRADVLSSYPAVDPDRVRVVHNGIDTNEYKPDGNTDVLERWAVDPDVPYVMFVGRITRQKGVPYLLEAARRFDRSAQLVLCAGAPDTPEIAAEVRGLVDQVRGDGVRVVWIEEMLARPDVAQLLTHATVFACPSVYEPFGLINLEAMACETAVVATAVGGIPEVVVEGETGYLVPIDSGGDPTGVPRDPARFARDFAERVNRLLADPETARRFGLAGRRRVEDHFSWPAIAAQTLEVYQSLT